MAHPNANRVVGGIDKPRFLILGPELSPNVSFEEGLSGVSGSAGAFSQFFDDSTPFGDYSLRIEDDDPNTQEYAEIIIDAGSPVAGRWFIVFAHARNDDTGEGFIWATFQGIMASGAEEIQVSIDANWRRSIVHELVVPGSVTGNILTYRIYPTGKAGGVANTGAVRIDNFHVREVLEEYTLPVPFRGKQKEIFRLVKQAEHELINGQLKVYKKGYRYYYEAGYERLSVSGELARTILANTDNDILFFPHQDAPICYLVKWADDVERQWAYGTAALGHEATVQVISQELLHEIPTEIIDSWNEYKPAQGALYIEGGQSAPSAEM